MRDSRHVNTVNSIMGFTARNIYGEIEFLTAAHISNSRRKELKETSK